VTGKELERATQKLWEARRCCSKCGRPDSVKLWVRPVMVDGAIAWGCTRCFHAAPEPREPSNPKKRRIALESAGQSPLFND
jgi:hypothetical protein